MRALAADRRRRRQHEDGCAGGRARRHDHRPRPRRLLRHLQRAPRRGRPGCDGRRAPGRAVRRRTRPVPMSPPPASAWPAPTGPKTSSCSAASCRSGSACPREPLVLNDAIAPIRAGTADGVGRVGGVRHLRRGRRPKPAGRGLPPRLLARLDRGSPAGRATALAAVWRSELGLGPETSLTARSLEPVRRGRRRWSCCYSSPAAEAGRSGQGADGPRGARRGDAGDGVAALDRRRPGPILGAEARACADAGRAGGHARSG